MKESGILFTPENIKLIMLGAKVQTRRVIAPQPIMIASGPYDVWVWPDVREDHLKAQWGAKAKNPESMKRFCPRGGVGDKLYIKEGVIVYSGTLVGYYMDGARATNHGEKRLTAIFMPKRCARTWLEITDVRVERVQDISESDCIAEGIQRQILPDFKGNHFHWGDKTKDRCKTEVEAYRGLWDSINKAKHPWSSKPWCWCLSFKVVKP